MPPDQPTDAGKDRETATAQREDIEERMGMSGLSHQQIVEALAARVSGDYYGSHVYLLASSQKSVVEWLLLALAAARREGQAQERRQAVRDGFDAGEDFCCGRLDMREWSTEKVERFRAERERLIAAAIRAREEPSR